MKTDNAAIGISVWRSVLAVMAFAVALTGCGGGASAPASSDKAITAFSLAGVPGIINETYKTISVTMPSGADVTALVATYTTTGAGVVVGTTPQVSGTTANNFTNPVTYVVAAVDGTTASYAVTVAVAPGSAKAITAFSLAGVNGNVNETYKAIGVTVPFGTDLRTLVATFTSIGGDVKVGTTSQISGVTANDFSSPVVYVVSAADGTTASYTITVAVAPSSAKAITAFSLAGVDGVVNETNKTIAVTMPFGTDVAALVATFTTTGASVAIGSTVQISGSTPNDFTNPVSYVASAADGTTAAYMVTVATAPIPAKAITAFSLAGVTGTINETSKTIAVTMPFGTDVTTLVATYTTTGASVSVGSTAQISGTTANDFTNPVTYLVTAADGTTASYAVTVAVAPSSAKAITAFSLAGVTANINEAYKAIGIVLPFNTDIRGLVATFISIGSDVKVGATWQISGVTANDFTNPVIYTVTAADGSTVNYSVTVVVAQDSAKAITAFSLAGITGAINETNKTIAVNMPFGTDVTALIATYTTSGASVAVGATTQASGTTSNDFTGPVNYVVSAADGTTASYTVTVAVAANPAKALTAFSLAGVVGVINETNKTIVVTMPYGTNVTGLIATFSTTGADVMVGTTSQISGTTPNNFTNSLVYKVIAANGTTANYTVTVTVAFNPAKAITAYSLAGVTGTVDEANKTIAVTMPYGTNVTALVATFTTTGASVKVGATSQYSGFYANDFTNPVTYTVTAADGTTTDYTVTVTVALSPAKAIVAFSLAGVTGTINEPGKTIAVTMPYGTDVTTLVATFTTTGANVVVGTTPQISGTTANDFTNQLNYTVIAANGTTVSYLVTVTVAPSPAKALTAFSLAGVTGTINETSRTIVVTMSPGTNVTALVATFTTTGVNVSVGSLAQISGSSANDFTNPVVYTVTAADGSSVNYSAVVILGTAPVVDGPSSDISRMVVNGTSVAIDVTIQPLNFTFTGTLYATATDPTGVFMSAVSVTSNGSSYTLTLATSTTVPAGHYTGNVTLNLCGDPGCTVLQQVPSIAVPFDINVMMPTSAWPGNNLSALSAWPGVPDWTTFQGNSAHTGYVPVDVDPNKFLTRWNMPAASAPGSSYALRSTLTTANGQFFVADNNNLYARNELDGSTVWQYSFSGLQYPSVNPPAVANGIVYIAAGQQSSTFMFAFNAADGTLVFKTPMSSQWEYHLAPTIGANGIYTNAGTYGGLYAFDVTGTRLYFASMAQTSMWTPAVDTTGVYSYTGGQLKVVDPVTGAVLHTISDPTFKNYIYEIGGSPVLGAAGSVFVANYENSLLNGGAIGNTLINFNVSNDSIGWQVQGVYPSTPAYAAGVLYVANNKPLRLEARAEADGALLWSWVPPQAGDASFNSEVLLTNNLVFVSTNLATYAIDVTSHKTVWSYPQKGRLALSQNGIFYIQGTNVLTAINLK